MSSRKDFWKEAWGGRGSKCSLCASFLFGVTILTLGVLSWVTLRVWGGRKSCWNSCPWSSKPQRHWCWKHIFWFEGDIVIQSSYVTFVFSCVAPLLYTVRYGGWHLPGPRFVPSFESRINKKKRGSSIIAGRKHYLSSKRKLGWGQHLADSAAPFWKFMSKLTSTKK